MLSIKSTTKRFVPATLAALSALFCTVCVGPALAVVTDINGLIVQRDTEENDPGGTNTSAYRQSNLLINGASLPGVPPTETIVVNNLAAPFTVFEDSYDNEPALPGFSANRTNAWFTDDGTDRYELLNAQPFEMWVTVNLDASLYTRDNRKEAGFRFQRPNDHAANSLFIVTVDDAAGGQVAAIGPSGIFVTTQSFDGLDPVNGVYVPGTDARLGFRYTPPGVNVITDPAHYEFIFDANADGVDMVTYSTTPNNFGGYLDGTTFGLYTQNHVADGNPDIFGDETTFANEFIDATFTDLVFIDPLTAIAGDYNASGQVEQGDLDLVLQNWGVVTDANNIPLGWLNDLPEGQIEQAELDGVLSNWGATAAPDFSGALVPEPAMPAALALWPLLSGRARARH